MGGKLAFVLTVALICAAPAAAVEPACYPKTRLIKKTRTVAKNDLARVFKVVRGDDYGSVYGCLFRKPRGRMRLGLDGDLGDLYGIGPLRLSGRFVAFYEWCSCRQNYQFYPRVRVVHLRTRRNVFVHVHREWATVVDLVLKRNGSVAWIAETRADPSDGASATSRTVFRHDSGGEAVLDSGFDIVGRSLARDGYIVTWLHGGERRSALLR